MRYYYFTIIILLFSIVTQQSIAQQEVDSMLLNYGLGQLKDSTIDQMLDYHYYEGLKFEGKRQFDKAKNEFERCLEISPKAAVYYELSRNNLYLQNSKEAFANIQKAVELSPENNYYQEQLASYYVAQHDYKSAINIYKLLNKRDPAKDDYLIQLVGLYTQTSDYKNALAVLDKLEKLDGMQERISFQRISIYYTLHQPKKIVDELNQLISKYPANTKYQNMLGDFYLERNKSSKALECYNKSLQYDSIDGGAYKGYMNYYLIKADTAMAIQYAIKALEDPKMDDNDRLSILKSVVVEWKFKDEKGKIDSLFNHLVQLYPNDLSIRNYRIDYFASISDTLNLIKQYREIIRIDPENQDNWLKLLQIQASASDSSYLQLTTEGERRFRTPQWTLLRMYAMIADSMQHAAVEHADSVLPLFTSQIQPQFQSSIMGICGDYYSAKDSFKLAFGYYDDALKLYSKNASVLNNYAYFLATLDSNLSKAEQMSGKAIEMYPTNATFLDTYAWVFFKEGDYNMAKFYIERALSQESDATLFEHYGDILFKLGDADKALVEWEKSRNLGNTSELLKQKIKDKQYYSEIKK